MVDIARFFMEFCRDESCGKCIPCRAGTVQMHEILARITRGEGAEGDFSLLEELSGLLRSASLCGLGIAAPNPVLSTLRHFRGEYEAHVREHRCPAGHCRIPVPGGADFRSARGSQSEPTQ
jgi:NADH:ubiquinone oxidoreductase subunit F (NADH-binding)